MHRLAPAPAVARAAQPAPPERRGGVELGGDVRIRVRRWQLAGLAAVEHEGGRLPGPQVDVRTNVAFFDDLERAASRKAELQHGRAEKRAVGGERNLVAG